MFLLIILTVLYKDWGTSPIYEPYAPMSPINPTNPMQCPINPTSPYAKPNFQLDFPDHIG